MASPRPSEDEVPRCSERQKLLKNRPRRLRLPASNHNNYNYGEPSPSTPCSVFSFDLPNSPAVLTTPRVRIQRALSQPAELIPASPHSIFNFDLPFEFGSQKTLRSSLSTPQTPITPGIKSPPFLTLPTIAEARGSFSSTVDREEATEQLLPCTTDWKSIRLIMIVILFTRIQFTTYFASLFPFMREVDSSASEYFYSFISVAYSIGIAGAAPLFGRWSNKLGCIRKPSIFSMYLMLATNLMYMFLHLFPFEAKWAMLVARFLAGIAAGGNALLPTYWTYAAAEQDRSSAAALFDGAFCLGLAFGPGFQLLFAPLGYPGFNIGPVTVNMYTVPAMVSILLIIITLILMIFHFNEVPMPKKEAKRGSIDSTSSSEASTGPILPPYDKLAVFICIFGKMIQMFVYACMETIGPMYTQRMFELDLSTTTKFSSMLVSLSGLLGFLFLLTYVWTKTGKKVDNRLGVIVGILVCIGFVLSTFPWSFYSNYINAEGCPETWSCYSRTPAIPQWLYAVAYTVVFGVGFALMNVHLAALYSSVLGPRRQGTMHGINTLLASLSRVLGPLAITDLYKHLGPIYVWIFQLSTWILLLLAFLVFYRRLTPCVPIQPPSAKTAETSK